MYRSLGNLIRLLLILLLSVFAEVQSRGQEEADTVLLRFAFYNVENFFDPYPNSDAGYHEFEPGGVRGWNRQKYQAKRDNIYRVVTALGGWNMPALVAFAEIENRRVLEAVTRETPLNGKGYEIIHYDSKDERDIDVGLIYDKMRLTPLQSQSIKIGLPDTNNPTRDILYVKFQVFKDTLHLFVNHWPSRYGGLLESAPYRYSAAKTLGRYIDSLCSGPHKPNILVMGDFNDNPDDISISIVKSAGDSCLLPLIPHTANIKVKGTYKYKQQWEYFDQILVSRSLLKGSLWINDTVYQVFDEDFLIELDEKHLGYKPYRNFIGFNYHGGFSDHLPVYVDIYGINRE
ncbi:MAG: endonuclease [bacterium]